MILDATAENIDHCVRLLQNGDIIGIPTETVYGLAGNALCEKSVNKIFSVKNRPTTDPLIVHCLNLKTVEALTQPNPILQKFADAFWPGPLTIVLHKKEIIPNNITAGLSSVAIRIPSNPIFRKVLKKTGFPLAAPSANPFGYVSPTLAEHIEQTLGDKIPAIIDGGPCDLGIESTIVDLRNPQRPTILRRGSITPEKINKSTGYEVSVDTKIASNTTAQNAPGQLSQHYSPKTKVKLLEHATVQHTHKISADDALLCNQRPSWYKGQSNVFWLSEAGDQNEIAQNLFHLMQKIDQQGFENIWIEVAMEDQLGCAINDRLRRAAAKSI